jgi:hypothetical protein
VLAAAPGLACTSRSPFTRSPANVALAEPCRYMGTFHKESRQRLEGLFSCRAISDVEWGCMARELRALDHAFTGRCRSERVAVDEILADQRARYGRCLAPAAAPVAACAALAEDDACGCLARKAAP